MQHSEFRSGERGETAKGGQPLRKRGRESRNSSARSVSAPWPAREWVQAYTVELHDRLLEVPSSAIGREGCQLVRERQRARAKTRTIVGRSLVRGETGEAGVFDEVKGARYASLGRCVELQRKVKRAEATCR